MNATKNPATKLTLSKTTLKLLKTRSGIKAGAQTVKVCVVRTVETCATSQNQY